MNYEPEELKRILEQSDRNQTYDFFFQLNLYLKSGEIPPHHWLLTASELLLNAAKARTTSDKNPIADALCLTHVTNKSRDSCYGAIVGCYFVKAQQRVDVSGIGWATEQASRLIKNETGVDKKPNTLRDIFKKDEKIFIKNAENFKSDNPNLDLTDYAKFILELRKKY